MDISKFDKAEVSAVVILVRAKWLDRIKHYADAIARVGVSLDNAEDIEEYEENVDELLATIKEMQEDSAKLTKNIKNLYRK